MEAQQLTEMFTSRAVSSIRMGGMEKHLSSLVMCRCIKHIEGRRHQYWMINCIVRIQCGLLLLPDEKKRLLHDLSRRIVTANYFVKEKCRDFVVRKEKEGFVFSDNGLMAKDATSLKLSLKTMSYTVSDSFIPHSVKFSRCAALMLKATKWMVLGCLTLPTANRGSPVTQPIFFREDAKNYCDPAYWPILQKGLCYMPAVRENAFNSQEQWIFHIHMPYNESSECKCGRLCEQCSRYQPISLFQLSQLAVLKLLFMKRRAHVLNKRKSPFF